MIKVLIADAHAVLRHGLRLILQEDSALSVVGEAVNSAETIAKTIDLKPDIVLIDIDMPDQCGVKTIGHIRTLFPQTQVVVLTLSNQFDRILPTCQAGAKGYLLKSVSGGEEIIQTIHTVFSGQAVLPQMLTTRLLEEIASPTTTPECLTDRELEVLRYMGQGFGNKEIAYTLSISQNTVKTHVRRIFGKLNLRNRTEAATYAMQEDLLV